jgi:hypothetical protein
MTNVSPSMPGRCSERLGQARVRGLPIAGLPWPKAPRPAWVRAVFPKLCRGLEWKLRDDGRFGKPNKHLCAAIDGCGLKNALRRRFQLVRVRLIPRRSPTDRSKSR